MSRNIKQNSITSPEKTAKINKNNIRLMEDFLLYLASVQKAESTINAYRSDLLIVFTYILDNLDNKDFVSLSKRDISAMQNWMVISNGNSSARVRRIKAAMSSLSNFIENMCDDDPEFKDFRSIVRKIENPVLQPSQEKTVWDDDELADLLDKLTYAGQYDKACALALGMYSGRRKSELCRFSVDDFKDENLVCDGALYKTSKAIRTKGRGGGKYIYCYTLAKKFKPYLDRWLKYREENGIDSEWLFVSGNERNKQLLPTTLTSWAHTFSAITGREFYWHSLRHYYTTSLVRAGLPDSVIQDIVGWDSADMCRLYTDIDADERISMYFKDGEIDTGNNKSLSDL